MSLHLSPDVERVVRERADAEGVSVNELLARTFAPAKGTLRPVNNPKDHVISLLAKWQAEDNTPSRPSVPNKNGETPTEALFRKWEEEDASMTEEEVEADERLWRKFQEGINETRETLGMRQIF